MNISIHPLSAHLSLRLARRMAPVLLAVAGLIGAAAGAQDRDLILAVSEGSSGGTDHGRVVAKYGALASAMSEVIKRKVVVVFVREFHQLEEGMSSGRFDFVMARPSDYPARGVLQHGYRYVAHAKPDGHCLLIVPKNSSIKSLADARGKRWIFPEKAAYMTKFCLAELRDRGIDLRNERVTYVREQASIGAYIDTGFADVGGVASYSGLAKEWQKAGNGVIHKSIAQPYFPLVAGKSVNPQQIGLLQKQLPILGQTDKGAAVLKTIGIEAFDVSGEARLKALPDWLGQPVMAANPSNPRLMP